MSINVECKNVKLWKNEHEGRKGKFYTYSVSVSKKMKDGSYKNKGMRVYPKDGLPCVVAATATPYKFPETCLKAFGTDVLTNPPPAFAALEKAPVTQTQVVDVAGIDDAVRALF